MFIGMALTASVLTTDAVLDPALALDDIGSQREARPPRTNRDLITYNQITARIMEKNAIPINDLYCFALPRLENI